MDKIQELIDDINNFKKCPENFKIHYIKSIKSKYIGYQGIFEYFHKLKEKIIIKLIKKIRLRSKTESKKEILNFYNKYTSLIELLIDNLDVKFDDEEIIKNDGNFKWKKNQSIGFESAINSNFINGIHSQATGSGKSLMALKIMWEYHKRNPKHNLLWLCERKDIPQKLFFDVEYNDKNKIIKVKNKTDRFNFGRKTILLI